MIIKILNLKLVIIGEYQNLKTFFQKVAFQIGLKILLSKIKNTVLRTHLKEDVSEEEIIETFYKKQLHKINRKYWDRKSN